MGAAKEGKGKVKAGVSPCVSIVIPAYNASKTICATLDSVLSQTVFAADEGLPAEVVVVDNASTDGTFGVVKSWLQGKAYRVDAGDGALGEMWRPNDQCLRNGPSILLLQSEVNKGPAAARNLGVVKTVAPWVAFLDADDLWTPWRLSGQFEFIRSHPDAKFLSGMVRQFEGLDEPPCLQDKPSVPGNGIEADALPIKCFAVNNPITLSTVLVQRKVVASVGGFDEAFRGPEDYDLWMRVATQCVCYQMHQVLTWYRCMPGGLSQNADTFLPEVLRVLDKAFASPDGALSSLCQYREAAIAAQYRHAAWMVFRSGARRRAIGYTLKSERYALAATMKGVRLQRPPLMCVIIRYLLGRS